MSAPTHVAFAEFVYLLLLTPAGVAVSAANAAVIAAASLLADIDTGSSTVGRMVPAVSLRVERSFGHRTLTHSALFVAGLALAALPLAASDRGLYACLVVGYATHPFLDTMNVGGVKLFYPFSPLRCVFPFDVTSPGRYRTPTGSGLDRALGALFLAACIPAFLISSQGHERFIRLAQQTIESAVRDYNEYSLTHRVVAVVAARNLFSKSVIGGRYEIAGALDDRTLLFLDEGGALHSLGRGFEAEYSAESVVCYPIEPVRTVVRTLELRNQVAESVAELCDDGPRTYLFGELILSDPVDLSPDHASYAAVSGSGRVVKLRYARPRELRREDLEGLMIESGLLTIRSELRAPLEADALDLTTGDPGRTAALGMRCRSGTDLEITASVGDTVRPGQVLARFQGPPVVSPLEAASLELRLLQLRAEVLEDSLELSRIISLSGEGFASGARASEAGRSLRESRDRLAALERRQALLLERSAPRARADSLSAGLEVLRCEYWGVVSDIRRRDRGAFMEATFVITLGRP